MGTPDLSVDVPRQLSVAEQNAVDRSQAMPLPPTPLQALTDVPPPQPPPQPVAPPLPQGPAVLGNADLTQVRPPTLPGRPQLPSPVSQSGPGTAVNLAGLLASLIAGPRGGGAPSAGVTAGLSHLDQQQMERWKLQQSMTQQAQTQYRIEAQQYQQHVESRQALLGQRIDAIKKDVALSKDWEDYNAKVSAAANDLRQQGFRVDDNWVRQAARWDPPEVVDQAKKIAEKVIKDNPWLNELGWSDPRSAKLAQSSYDITPKDPRLGVYKPKLSEIFSMADIQVGMAGVHRGQTKAYDDDVAGETTRLLAEKKAMTGVDITAESDPKAFRETWQQAKGNVDAQSVDKAVKTRVAEAAALKSSGLGPATPVDRAGERFVQVRTKDPATGRGIVTYRKVKDIEGQPIDMPLGSAEQARVDQAQTVHETGQKLIAQLQDPKQARDLVGVLKGRGQTLQQFIGNPDPRYARLATQLHSFELANMGVHGMRSAQGAQWLDQSMRTNLQPDALVGAIQGLMDYSDSFVANAGVTPPSASQVTGKGPGQVSEIQPASPTAGQTVSRGVDILRRRLNGGKP